MAAWQLGAKADRSVGLGFGVVDLNLGEDGDGDVM